MTREEFILQLEDKLQDELDQGLVRENVQFYNNYIDDEMKSGNSEKEVLEALGDPWAIAKSIIQAQGMGSGFRDNVVMEEHVDDNGSNQNRRRASGVRFHNFSISGWKILFFCIALFFVVVLAIVIFARIIIALAPIIIIGVIVLLVLRFLGNR